MSVHLSHQIQSFLLAVMLVCFCGCESKWLGGPGAGYKKALTIMEDFELEISQAYSSIHQAKYSFAHEFENIDNRIPVAIWTDPNTTIDVDGALRSKLEKRDRQQFFAQLEVQKSKITGQISRIKNQIRQKLVDNGISKTVADKAWRDFSLGKRSNGRGKVLFGILGDSIL